MKIIVCGDVHGCWGFLNELIKKEDPNIILQCGDFGYWPSFDMKMAVDNPAPYIRATYKFNGIENDKTKIYWCDGNHEEFSKLNVIKNNETHPNVFYMKRGATLTLPDGRVVLFMGGAESIDKHYRIQGLDWFPEELITQKDVYNLPDIKVDIIISHTCPTEFNIYDGLMLKCNDPSRKALSTLLEKYNPSLWYFAHWHIYAEGSYKDTKWFCLNMSGEDNWWKVLYDKNK